MEDMSLYIEHKIPQWVEQCLNTHPFITILCWKVVLLGCAHAVRCYVAPCDKDSYLNFIPIKCFSL